MVLRALGLHSRRLDRCLLQAWLPTVSFPFLGSGVAIPSPRVLSLGDRGHDYNWAVAEGLVVWGWSWGAPDLIVWPFLDALIISSARDERG